MSKSREALVGAAGMNDKKRGLSHETTAVASLSTKSFEHLSRVVAFGAHEPGELGVERLDEAAEVEGTGSMESRSRQAATMRSVIASS